MLLIKIFRFFSGYVEFFAKGGFGERFINLCSIYDIPLWNVRACNDGFFARTTPEGYKNILVCARKSGVKTSIKRKVGIPFIIHRYRRRWGLAVGAIFLVLCLSLLSTRIWLIDVSGNSTVTDEEIIECVKEAGLFVGSRKAKLNPPQISLYASGKIEKLSWISVNISGSCANIEVREGFDSPKIRDSSGKYNLVASRDAQLIILETYNGSAQAKIFNPVLKGEVLISGVDQNKDESAAFTHADGYAVGRTEDKFNITCRADEKIYKNKLVRRVRKLYFFGIEIPLGKAPKEYDCKFDVKKYFSLGSKAMPLGVFYSDYSKKTTDETALNQSRTKLIACTRFLKAAAEYSKTHQTISSSFNVKTTAEESRLTADFAGYENIGKEVPFETDNIAPEEQITDLH